MLSLGAMTTDEISIGFLNLLIEFIVVIVHSSRKTVSYSSITVEKLLSMRGIDFFTYLARPYGAKKLFVIYLAES